MGQLRDCMAKLFNLIGSVLLHRSNSRHPAQVVKPRPCRATYTSAADWTSSDAIACDMLTAPLPRAAIRIGAISMSFCEFCGYDVPGPCDNAKLAARCQSLRSPCSFCGREAYVPCEDAEAAERCRTRHIARRDEERSDP